MEIKHFSHEHPLIPRHEVNKKVRKLVYQECSACTAITSSRTPSYGCVTCDFYLHDNCARLKTEIRHRDHPDHPLLLTQKPYESKRFTCKGCSRNCSGFSYHCSECAFDLDVECALEDKDLNNSSSPTVSFQHEGHQLVLSHTPRVWNSICSICDDWGKFLEPPLFKCKERQCIYSIHVHCAPLAYPPTNRNKHLHPLVHCEHFVEDDSGEYYCDACEQSRNPTFPVYYCVQCSSLAPYTAHMTCALSHQVLQSLANEYESSEKAKTLQYHQHHLILTNRHHHDYYNEKCIVCKSTIGSGNFLLCEQCGFRLHYSCRQLEIEVDHATHENSLTLHVDQTHVGPFYQCNACKEMCLCFIYHCVCCNFNLCVRCFRSVHATTIFKYQDHRLFLFNCAIGCRKCDFCRSDNASPRLICVDPGCPYNLHFNSRCAPLSFPDTIKHKDFDDSFNLTDDDSFTNGCRICGGHPYEDEPFYRLSVNECAHVSCVLLEKLPSLIAGYENSPEEYKANRLQEELQVRRIEVKEMDAELTEIDNQLLENERIIEDTENTILKLVEQSNFHQNKWRL